MVRNILNQKLKPISYDSILKNGVLIYGHDKRGGWLKIVEAFFAILLITGVLLFLVSKGYIGNNEGNSEKVYQIENSILREIQLNDGYRNQILGASPEEGNPPDTYWETPGDIAGHIEERLPNYLSCNSKICKPERVCGVDVVLAGNKEVYVQSVLITVTLDQPTFSPRKLTLACWEK